MDAKELRIGNYVGIEETALHANGCNYLEAIFEIEEIKKEVAQFKGFHAGEYYKDLKPIPLTEDWLYDFGFLLDNGFTTYKINIFKGYLRVALDGSWGVYKDEYSNRTGSSYNNKIKIEYVHQLQNLYFTLTGEELIIIK